MLTLLTCLLIEKPYRVFLSKASVFVSHYIFNSLLIETSRMEDEMIMWDRGRIVRQEQGREH